MNDLYFRGKNKKGLKDQSLSQKVYMPSANDGLRPYCIRHEVAEYHPSENEYISLLDEYIINAEHCIDARSSLFRRFAPYIITEF